MDTILIGKNIRRIRESRHISQENISKLAGISRVAYRSIETGQSAPRVSTLQSIASALDVKLAELLTPVKQLQHVRFRSLKRMTSRESILNDVAKWLSDFNFLENLLEDYEDYKFKDFQNLLSSDLEGESRAIQAARLAREMLGLNGNDAIRDIAGLIESSGIKLYPIRLASDGFFGLSVSAQEGGPAIIVNVWDRIAVERWIFSAAHELGHLLLHLDSYDTHEVVEDSCQEDEANIFASFFLMPEDAFIAEWKEAAGLDLVDRVFKIKRIFQVSYKTVLYRIYKHIGDRIWIKFNIAFKNKYGQSLKGNSEPEALHPTSFHPDPEILKSQEPDPLSSSNFIEDRLSGLVRKAVDAELITLGRGAEILCLDLNKMREIASTWV